MLQRITFKGSLADGSVGADTACAVLQLCCLVLYLGVSLLSQGVAGID